MSDPTPTPTTPAVTARSAREALREHVEALGGHWTDSLASALRDDTRWSPNFRRVAKSYAALRALLDAPTGAVERLCEAAEAIWRESLDLLDFMQGKNAVPRLQEILGDIRVKADALRAALAAVRASPEAIGAGADLRPELRSTVKALDEARAEHLAAAEDMRKAIRERDEARQALNTEKHAHRTTLEARDRYFAARAHDLKADLEKARQTEADLRSLEKTAWKRLDEAHAEIMRLRADRDRAAMPTTGNGATPPPATEAPKFTDGGAGFGVALGYGGADMLKASLGPWQATPPADVAGSFGVPPDLLSPDEGRRGAGRLTLRPGPMDGSGVVVEAPISERAGAVLISTVRIYLGEGGAHHAEDAGPLKCEPTWTGPGELKLRLAFLAAAERAVKGEGATS